MEGKPAGAGRAVHEQLGFGRCGSQGAKYKGKMGITGFALSQQPQLDYGRAGGAVLG